RGVPGGCSTARGATRSPGLAVVRKADGAPLELGTLTFDASTASGALSALDAAGTAACTSDTTGASGETTALLGVAGAADTGASGLGRVHRNSAPSAPTSPSRAAMISGARRRFPPFRPVLDHEDSVALGEV